MVGRVLVAKAANSEQLGWRHRIQQNEGAVSAAFLAWAAALQHATGESELMAAVVARAGRALDHVLAAVAFQPPLAVIAEREAEREFQQVIRQVDAQLHLSFDLHDPNFTTAVREHEARLVREVSTETRRALANMIDRGYTMGIHPDRLAPVIRQAVGLTRRQGQAVLSFQQAQEARGVDATVAQKRAERYAGKLLNRRAKTIGRTETATAAMQGRLASYDQAANAGLFDRATAELEWSSVQEDPTEICAQLDGERVPLGEDFDGLMPPAHVCCRCEAHLVL